MGDSNSISSELAAAHSSLDERTRAAFVNTVKAARQFCSVDHNAVKDDAAWDSLELIGTMPTYDDTPGSPQTLQLRNCSCGSTLAKEMP